MTISNATFFNVASGQKIAYSVRLPGVSDRQKIAAQWAEWIAQSRTGLSGWVTEQSTIAGWRCPESGLSNSIETERRRVEVMAVFVAESLGSSCPEVTFGPARLLRSGTRLSFGLLGFGGTEQSRRYSTDQVTERLKGLTGWEGPSFQAESVTMVSGGWPGTPEQPTGAGFKEGLVIHLQNCDLQEAIHIASPLCKELGIYRYEIEQGNEVHKFKMTGILKLGMEHTTY
jgi:hypothetical protein